MRVETVNVRTKNVEETTNFVLSLEVLNDSARRKPCKFVRPESALLLKIYLLMAKSVMGP